MLALNATLDARDAFSRARLRYLLANAIVLVLDFHGNAAGFCAVTRRGYVQVIAVAPEHRRRGIGLALLRAAIEQSGPLRCQIRASNTASEQLFKRSGFKVRGIRPGVYADGEAALEMQLL